VRFGVAVAGDLVVVFGAWSGNPVVPVKGNLLGAGVGNPLGDGFDEGVGNGLGLMGGVGCGVGPGTGVGNGFGNGVAVGNGFGNGDVGVGVGVNPPEIKMLKPASTI
jgi:hypothetical protein